MHGSSCKTGESLLTAGSALSRRAAAAAACAGRDPGAARVRCLSVVLQGLRPAAFIFCADSVV